MGAAIAIAIGVVIFAWLLLKDDDDGTSSSGSTTPGEAEGSGPVEAGLGDLREVAASSSVPVYWAGERPGHRMERTQTASGRVFVRYLPLSVAIGEERPAYLTVGTYPTGNAFGAVQAVGRRTGGATRIPGGGLLVGARRSERAHFSYPDAGYQVEVFAPVPGQARKLVLDGKVQPVR